MLSKTDLESIPDKDFAASEMMSEISIEKENPEQKEMIRKMFDSMHQDNNINFKEIENNPMYGHDLQNRYGTGANDSVKFLDDTTVDDYGIQLSKNVIREYKNTLEQM